MRVQERWLPVESRKTTCGRLSAVCQAVGFLGCFRLLSSHREGNAMTCPQCNHAVPAKSLWTRAGFSSVVCPYCHASLCPTAQRAILLFVISFVMGNSVLVLLRHNGAKLWVTLAGFSVVFVAVFTVLAPLVLRLRLKGSSGE